MLQSVVRIYRAEHDGYLCSRTVHRHKGWFRDTVRSIASIDAIPVTINRLANTEANGLFIQARDAYSGEGKVPKGSP